MRELLHRVIAGRLAFGALCFAYGSIVLVIMAPALLSSVGGDDTYFILMSINAGGAGPFDALLMNLPELFVQDTSGEQPRTVPLAITARRLVAIIALWLGVTFDVPLAAMWAVSKVIFLLLTLLSVAVLLRQVRFRGADGDIRGLSRSSMAFVLLVLPLVTALGIKAQIVGGINGWIFYPVLTLTTIPTIFFTAALCLWLLRKLEVDFRRWVLPSVIVLAMVAFILNYSYEFVAVAIPVSALAILLNPRPVVDDRWQRWRPTVAVAGALVGTFTVIFLINRWRLSQWPCIQDGSCYGGSLLEVNPISLARGLVAALPSSVTSTIETSMEVTGRSLPPFFTPFGVLVGVLALVLLAATWAAFRAREERIAPRLAAKEWLRTGPGRDDRGLVTVLAISAVTALGVSVVSGITSRAVAQVTTEMSYRSGPAVWTDIALVVVTLLWMLLRRLSEVGSRVVAVAASTLAVIAIAHLLPLNLAVAQAERASPRTQSIDAIHWDVVLGDLTERGAETRCANAEYYTSLVGAGAYFSRTVRHANIAFEYFYGIPHCPVPPEEWVQ